MKVTPSIVGALLLIALNTASAVPISGSIGFTGSYSIWDTDGASYVSDFTIGDEIQFELDAVATGTITGSFAAEGITAGDSAAHSDLTYNPTGPINGLWSIGSFTFDLTSMNVDAIGTNFLVLSGNGLFSSTDSGLDDTLGEWQFSANTAGVNFTWSSSSVAVVPVPPAVWLFGSGLMGIIGAARRKKAA